MVVRCGLGFLSLKQSIFHKEQEIILSNPHFIEASLKIISFQMKKSVSVGEKSP